MLHIYRNTWDKGHMIRTIYEREILCHFPFPLMIKTNIIANKDLFFLKKKIIYKLKVDTFSKYQIEKHTQYLVVASELDQDFVSFSI